MSSVVARVEAGQLDPSWLGGLFEVVEETRDGPARTGFRLRGYTIPEEGKVRLVTETSTLAVDPGTVLRCYTVAAAPGRWTGHLPPGAAYPAAPVLGPVPPPAPMPGPGPVVPPAQPVARPVASAVPVPAQQPAAYPPPAPMPMPGLGPVAGQPPGGPARPGITPAGPPPWQRTGQAAAGQGWAQPGGSSGGGGGGQ